jgi:DUF971 family protein
VAEHPRSFARRADVENPEHVRELEERKRQGARQRLRLRFLELSPAASAYQRGLEERRLNAGHHLASIVGLVALYGAEAVGRAIESAHELGAYSSDYILNLLEQRARALPQAGPLHLTRADALAALELELRPPDLSPYTQ